MPARGIQHVDLAVGDVGRSLAFYSTLLGPLGLKERFRNPTYRGTEEVVYLEYGVHGLGLRPADSGPYRYYGIGMEHLAFEVDRAEEVDEALSPSRAMAFSSVTRRMVREHRRSCSSTDGLAIDATGAVSWATSPADTRSS